jgi:hypothetical protein
MTADLQATSRPAHRAPSYSSRICECVRITLDRCLCPSDCVMPTQRDVAEWREQSDGYMSPAKFRKRGLASTVTLSGLLNAIDGVTSQVGSAWKFICSPGRRARFYSHRPISPTLSTLLSVDPVALMLMSPSAMRLASRPLAYSNISTPLLP